MTSEAPHRTRRMTGRDRHERHRVATNLELLFDLTFVVAFSFAGNELAHAITSGHVGSGVLAFCFAMFATNWAWINFSWFASAFDVDDWIYRLTTMVQMVGVLIFTLGIPAMFASLEEGEHLDLRLMVVGYVVMRVALIAQWLRAARESPEYAAACRGYAKWTAIGQVGWIVLLLGVHQLSVPVAGVVVVLLIGIESMAPVLAERERTTPWHAHHIAERYGLLAIITLGEGIVGSVATLSATLDADGWSWQLVAVGLASVGLTFSLWWCYFTLPSAQVLHRFGNSKAFVWGYGHIVLFAGLAGVGAGLHVAALEIEGHGEHLSAVGAVLSVMVPVAVFMVGLFATYTWLVGEPDRFHLLLLAVAAVFLVLPVLLAAAHVPMPVCLLVLTLAPVSTVVGYETAGHRHIAAALERIGA